MGFLFFFQWCFYWFTKIYCSHSANKITAAIKVWNMWRLIVSTPTIKDLVLIDSVREVNENEIRKVMTVYCKMFVKCQQYFILNYIIIKERKERDMENCFAMQENTGSSESCYKLHCNIQYIVWRQRKIYICGNFQWHLNLCMQKRKKKERWHYLK